MHQIKIVLGDFNAKLGRENIFTPTTGNEILHENISDNGVKSIKLYHIKKSNCKEHNVRTAKHSHKSIQLYLS
jgi:hypothetical protein